jgi:hypothetical protein
VSRAQYDEWLSGVEPGDMLLVLQDAPLYPQSMWTQLSDDDTWILSMPVLEPDDHVIVLDVMNDDHDPDDVRTFAALVMTHLGVGCVLLLKTHFGTL